MPDPNQHSELRQLAESALRRPVHRHTGVLVTDVQAKALAHGVCDLIEQYEIATRKLAREQARKRHYKDELELAQARVTDQESSERVLLEQLEAARKALEGAERFGEGYGLTEATYWFRDVRAVLASYPARSSDA